jgi:hypothetical protein
MKLMVGVIVSILVLAGCTADPTPSASSSVTPTVEPSAPEPSTSPSPDVTPVADDCPTWEDTPEPQGIAPIDINRYYGVCIGMSFAEANEGMNGYPVAGEDMCPWYTVLASQDPLYVVAVTHPDAPGDEIFLFRLSWQGLPTDALAYEMPRTAENIGIGSTEAELVAAYPQATFLTVDDMSRGPRDQYVLAGDGGNSMVFDVIDGYVAEITWGQNLGAGATGEYCAL